MSKTLGTQQLVCEYAIPIVASFALDFLLEDKLRGESKLLSADYMTLASDVITRVKT